MANGHSGHLNTRTLIKCKQKWNLRRIWQARGAYLLCLIDCMELKCVNFCVARPWKDGKKGWLMEMWKLKQWRCWAAHQIHAQSIRQSTSTIFVHFFLEFKLFHPGPINSFALIWPPNSSNWIFRVNSSKQPPRIWLFKSSFCCSSSSVPTTFAGGKKRLSWTSNSI